MARTNIANAAPLFLAGKTARIRCAAGVKKHQALLKVNARDERRFSYACEVVMLARYHVIVMRMIGSYAARTMPPIRLAQQVVHH